MSLPADADARSSTTRNAIAAWYAKAREYLSDGFRWDVVDRLYPCNPEGFHPRSIAGHNLEWVIEGALKFLENCAGMDQPFFLYLPVTVPHSRYKPDVFERADPLATPAGLLSEPPTGMPPREEITRRIVAAGLEDYAREGLWLDEAVKAVMRKLKEKGLEEDTCFIFTTDHPTAGKETCHLGRIPLIVRWPVRVQPGTASDALLSEADLAPTILDIAQVHAPTEMLQDGASFKAHLLSQEFHGRDTVFMEVVNSRAIVSGKWKYIANRLPDELKAGARLEETGWLGTKYYDNVQIRDSAPYDVMNLFPHYLDPDHLYDLEHDPLEQANLADDPRYRSVVAEMKEKLSQQLRRMPHRFGEFA